MLNGPPGRTANLCSTRSFGDVELYLEFMIAKGSNSGVYLQGLYQMQIFDSWGSSDGVVVGRRRDLSPLDRQPGVGGSAPLVNASRRPGEWQSYQAWFRGPRFDGGQEDPARAVPARAFQRSARAEGRRRRRPHARAPRRAGGREGPLMIQGDHGPVAFRDIYVRPLRPLILR